LENRDIVLKTHFALAVDKREEVDAWEERFEEEGVDVLGKVEWPTGGKSVYFQDLDGHVGEIASRGIWPHY
jgi:catechol 2,3-dioxygenase-like lactoylglutathione lyase family enzyme